MHPKNSLRLSLLVQRQSISSRSSSTASVDFFLVFGEHPPKTRKKSTDAVLGPPYAPRMTSPPQERFQTTRWSLVRSVRDVDSAVAQRALEELCSDYWFPLYAWLRRSGHRPEDASDFVQGFFLELLARDDLRKISEEGGRFRSWLLSGLMNHCRNVDAGARALKRGGGKKPLSLSFDDAEARYAGEPADERWTPERLFLRSWALSLLELVTRRLREEAEASDREALFVRLLPHIAQGSVEAYEEIGEEFGLAAGTVKVTLHRWRRRFRELMAEEVAQTVAGPDEVEAELQRLRDALS